MSSKIDRRVRLMLVPSDLPILAEAMRGFGKELVAWRRVSARPKTWPAQLFELTIRAADEKP